MNPLARILPHLRQPKRCSYSTPLLLPLFIAGILLAGVNTYGTTNHPPSLSWIRDQLVGDQQGQQTEFETVYFRPWDAEDQSLTPVAAIEYDMGSPHFLNSVNIEPCGPNDDGCPDHGFKVIIDEVVPPEDGSATIVVTATDTGGAIGKASFTLRRQNAAVNPPVIGGIPGEQIQKNATLDYGPLWFVVDDLNATGVDDTLDANGDSIMSLSATSDNPSVVLSDPSSFTFEQAWAQVVAYRPCEFQLSHKRQRGDHGHSHRQPRFPHKHFVCPQSHRWHQRAAIICALTESQSERVVP
jgi:hypothetical protein